MEMGLYNFFHGYPLQIFYLIRKKLYIFFMQCKWYLRRFCHFNIDIVQNNSPLCIFQVFVPAKEFERDSQGLRLTHSPTGRTFHKHQVGQTYFLETPGYFICANDFNRIYRYYLLLAHDLSLSSNIHILFKYSTWYFAAVQYTRSLTHVEYTGTLYKQHMVLGLV